MGCHTWCARKVDRTITEARELWLVKNKEILDWLDRMHVDAMNERAISYDWTVEYIERLIALYKRRHRMVSAGLCNVAVMNQQPEHSHYIEGKGFFVDTDYHDLFRVGGYPNARLFSKDECIQYMKDNADKIIKHDDTDRLLDEFWSEHPDGCIHFG